MRAAAQEESTMAHTEMTAARKSPVTSQDIDAYEKDGVVRIRGLLDGAWVERMHKAIDRVQNDPGEFRERYAPGTPGHFLSDKFMWTRDPDFRAYAFESDAPKVAGRLMQANKINLFYDHLLIKEPGTSAPTPWHQDMNYWPAEGDQICSIWLALDRTGLDNGGMEFVLGSHRAGSRYKPFDFRTKSVDTDEFEDLPDVESDRSKFNIADFDLEPGDAVVFHGLTLHAAPGNDSTRRRRALSVRFTGDDVRFIQRKKMIKLLKDPGLKVGDPLDSDLFPVVWRKGH
jgi:ectoine hydroxylase-related dioxygenase (phytanoyl-CoA dioxygenase family)